MWDDGDDLYAEPRAPYPHTREVLLLRAHDAGCAALVGGIARSVEAGALVAVGLGRGARRGAATEVRAAAPLVSVTGATDRELERDPAARSRPAAQHARTPRSARRSSQGPVLVQTPRARLRRGRWSATAAASRRAARPAPGRCTCRAPHLPPTCRWCGAEAPGAASAPSAAAAGCARRCWATAAPPRSWAGPSPECRCAARRGDRVLDRSTAGRRSSSPHRARSRAPTGGYAAVVLLDTWLMLARPDLRTAEEAVRRWFNAAAAGPSGRRGRPGGRRSVTRRTRRCRRWCAGTRPASPSARPRSGAAAHLPPASRIAVLSGAEDAVDGGGRRARAAAGRRAAGPGAGARRRGRADRADEEPQVRAGRAGAPRRWGPALSRALVEMQGVRSARKLPAVRVQVDPYALG